MTKPIMVSVDVEVEDSQRQSCEKCCGFFSFPATKNLCSMCYNDYYLINERAMLPRIKTQMKTPNYSQSCSLFDPLVRVLKQVWPSIGAADDSVNDLKSNYCEYFCDNKVGFFESTCCCGGRFCVMHRLPEEHACDNEHMQDYRN